MLRSSGWRIGSMALLVAALTLGAAGLVSGFSTEVTPVAFANLLGDDDNDNEDESSGETVGPAEFKKSPATWSASYRAIRSGPRIDSATE